MSLLPQEAPQAFSFKAEATHWRMRPFVTKFTSKFHYVLYKLQDPPPQSILFSETNKGLSVLKVYPRMFLTEGYSRQGMSVLANLRKTLSDKGYNPHECANSVWVMTIPGTIGVSTMNNVTVYYCYAKSGNIRLAIFETHSHLLERYIHITDHESDSMREPITGYSHCSVLPKNFHISPIHSRKGFYEYHYTIPVDFDDGTVTEAQRSPWIRVTVLDENMKRLFYSSLKSQSLKPVNVTNIINLLSTHMLSNAWAGRHIFIEGWRSVVTKKTPHYPQPTLTDSKNNQSQDNKDIGFLGLPTQTRLNKYCQSVVEDALQKSIKLHHCDVRICFTFIDSNILPVIIEADSHIPKQQIDILVRSFELYKSLLVSPNAEYAVSVWGEQGDDYFRTNEVSLLQQVLKSTESQSSTSLSNYIRGAFTQLTSGGIKHPDQAKKIDFSLRTEPFLTSSWLASVVMFLIYLEWRILELWYTTMNLQIISHSLIPWQPLNKLVHEKKE